MADMVDIACVDDDGDCRTDNGDGDSEFDTKGENGETRAVGCSLPSSDTGPGNASFQSHIFPRAITRRTMAVEIALWKWGNEVEGAIGETNSVPAPWY